MTVLSRSNAVPDPTADLAVLDPGGRLRFLLIEDSTTDSELVRALLEEEFPHGVIDVATSLETALGRLAASHYDLILADLTLPDAEGEVVVRAVRGASPETALMVLTGRVDGTLALWSLAEGAQDYLVKGEHDGPRLAEALRHGLQRSRTEQLARSRLVAALKLESEAAEHLRALDAAKNDFVATASHELRTPLTNVVAYAEMLQEEAGLSPRQEEFVAAIARNAARLAALADDLLLLSGSASPQLEAETTRVDMGAVVSSARSVVETLAAEKHLAVSFELPDRPVYVTGNAAQLERVLANLVCNAVKFTEDGGSVRCRLTLAGSEVVVTVTDTGVGVPEAEQEHLFERFFRGAYARDRAVQGTGLGLHIVASVVSSHGGDIAVDSVEGQGTTVTVRLPAAGDPDGGPIEPAGLEPLVGRLVALLGLPRSDPEADDLTAMLVAAWQSAQQTGQWRLFADAVRFVEGRLRARGLIDVDAGGLGAALLAAAGSPAHAELAAPVHDLPAEVAGEPVVSPWDAPDVGPRSAAYVERVLVGDRKGAVSLARQWVREGLDASEILLDILEPAQREVGRRWALGQISVVQEHFCTAVTQFVMTQLYPGIFDAVEESERRLVAVHAHGSLHYVGLRMVTDVLECRGWSTTYVGDEISVDALVALLVDDRSDLLLVSASMPGQIPALTDMIRAIRQDPRTRGVKVVVGGRPFLVAPDLVDAVGADGWARDARDAVAVCDELMGGADDQR